MARKNLVDICTGVRDGANQDEIEKFAATNGMSSGEASLYLRLRRINSALNKIRNRGGDGTDAQRFMNGRRIKTRHS